MRQWRFCRTVLIVLVMYNLRAVERDPSSESSANSVVSIGYSCQVKTWPCDLTDFEQLDKTLKEIEGFGGLECVLYNAARVAGKPPLDESIEDIERDFRVCTFHPFYQVVSELMAPHSVD
jgi:NAD(P)-dependent dehydrogenase (short-subunit alcohol dehydrogenase family)